MADLHLSPIRAEMAAAWMNRLAELKNIDALYILGDLFEVWLGDDDHHPFNRQIIDALAQASQSYTIHIQKGNRDFLIGAEFARSARVHLIEDEYRLGDYLLIHGDQLCTQDQAYQKSKAYLRHPDTIRAFLEQPLAKRKQIAAAYRQQSRHHQYSVGLAYVDPTSLNRILDQHGLNRIIHGHTHQFAIHHWYYQGQIRQRIVLPDWKKQNTPILILSGSDFEWI